MSTRDPRKPPPKQAPKPAPKPVPKPVPRPAPGRPPAHAPAQPAPRVPTQVRTPTDSQLYPTVGREVVHLPPQAPPPTRRPTPSPQPPRRWPAVVAVLLLLGALGAGALWLWQREAGLRGQPITARPATGLPAPSPEPAPIPGPTPAPSVGNLTISVEPDGAVLWVDGNRVGDAIKSIDFKVLGLVPREYALKVAKDGYQTVERKVAVEAGKTLTIRLVAEPLPRLTWDALCAAAKEAKAAAILACFSREAQARIAETDKLLADNAKDLPEPLKGRTFLAALAAKLADAKPPVELGEEKVAGDKATLEVKWPSGAQTLAFLKEDGAWKIGLPLPDLDRLKSEAETALKAKRDADAQAARAAKEKADAEAALKAKQQAEDLARAAAKKVVENFWAAAKAADREALLACLDPAARKKAEDLDQRVADFAKQFPALAEKRLIPALGKKAREARIELGDAKLDGDKATLDATLGTEKDAVQLARDGAAWKIALPFPELDRIGKQVDEEAAAAAEKEAKDLRETILKALAGRADEKDLSILARGLVKAKDAAERDPVEKAILAAFEHVKDADKCSEPLVAALGGADAAARCVLLRLLARVDGPKALEAVRAARKDANAEVRDAAAKAVTEWPNASAAADLLALAKEAGDEARGIAALQAFIRQAAKGKEAPADERLKLLDAAAGVARRMEEKKLVIEAAEGVGGLGALKLVQRYLLDPAVAPEALAAQLKLARALAATHRDEALAALRQVIQLARDRNLKSAAEQELASLEASKAPPIETPKAEPKAAPEPTKQAAVAFKLYTQWPFDAAEAKRRQQETAKALGVPVEQDVDLGNGIKMTFVLIPPGEFMMGDTLTPEEVARRWPFGQSKADLQGLIKWCKNAHPRHLVRLTRPFYLGKTEVTRGQFAEFVRDAAYRTDRERAGGGNAWRSSGFKQTDEHPVVLASWNDATAFCQWLSGKAGKRLSLPTEAQWEYACRAGSDGTWPWGDREADAQGRANIAGEETTVAWKFRGVRDNFRETAPVATFAPNAFGLHDMIGNAWEWCADWFGETYYQDSPRGDPQGPSAGQFRVVRGGSWLLNPRLSRTPYRCREVPTAADDPGDGGFRLSWTLK